MIKIFIFILLFHESYTQNLFDNYNVHSLDIQFYNPNYDQILQTNWELDDKTYELARIVFNGEIIDSVGVRYKGNSTFFFTQLYGSPKYPFNIDLNIIYDDQELLGYNKIKLSNSIFDPTFIKESLGYLVTGYYLPTPESGYINVSLDGELLGLYVSVESINKAFLTKHFGNNDGVFFKCEPQFLFGEPYYAYPDLVWYGNDTTEYAYQKGYELKSNYGWEELINLIYTLNFDIDNIDSILNVDRVLWYFASAMVLPDLDAYNGMYMHNFYLYKNTSSGKFEIIPWDKDNSFGGAMINTIIDLGGNETDIYNWDPFLFSNDQLRPLFSKLMSVPLYKDIYSAHIRTIIEDIYNVDYFQELAYNIQDAIEINAQNDPNLFLPFTFSDYFQYNVDNFLTTFGGGYWCGITSTIAPRLNYLNNHNEISQITPIINSVIQDNVSPTENDQVIVLAEVFGAELVELMVSIDSPASNFISIPMYDDGDHADFNSNDNIYGTEIPYQESGLSIKYYVRASNSDALILDPRKAENEFYQYYIEYPTEESSVIINEINYNSADDFNSGDWIEFYNNSDQVQDISHWNFKDGNDNNTFIIPDNVYLNPYSYTILCNDLNAFNQMFPDITNILGVFNFGLSSNGELLRLFNENNNIVDIVEYDSNNPWPNESNGNGPTLELINPYSDNSSAENWTYSIGNGTPGLVNSTINVSADINNDGEINVVDVIMIVNMILGVSNVDNSADLNQDGLINVVDVIQIVNLIINNITLDAKIATISNDGHLFNLSGDGYIGAVQISLTHEKEFKINLNKEALVAEYHTDENKTIIVVIAPESKEIFSTSYEYEMVEIIVTNSKEIIPVTHPYIFSLEQAYPNPFNPITNIDFSIPKDMFVSINIFDLKGRNITTLAKKTYNAGYHTLSWNADQYPSGFYFVKMVAGNFIDNKKIILLK